MNTQRNEWSEKRRLLLVLALLTNLLWCGCADPQSASARLSYISRRGDAMVNTSEVQNTYLQPGGMKVLAEGFHSKIEEPFVAVLRDREAYAALASLDDNLPKLDADFFKENAVLAAFLGQRNTGGYSVEISPSPVDINILEKRPGKGMMQTQMITSPFKIVALQGVGNQAIRLNPDEAWRNKMEAYRVTTATFTMTGGFAGRSERFGLQGVVGVFRLGKLTSFIFRLVSSEGKRRLLMESSAGLNDGDKVAKIDRLSVDSLIDPPTNGLTATVTFSEKGRKLLVSLVSRPTNISDGYSGQGTVEAELGSANKP